jgi:hypothetical protein
MARGSVARNGAAWSCAAVMLLLPAACGGQSFVLDADAGLDAGSVTPVIDAAADAPPANFEIPCGANQCAYPLACCNGTEQLSVSCTGGNGQCSACQAHLACATAANCPGNMLCCIGPTTVGATGCPGNERFVSTCRFLCASTETRMCDPTNSSVSPCVVGRACMSTASQLAQWGLPSDGSNYGVCPAN